MPIMKPESPRFVDGAEKPVWEALFGGDGPNVRFVECPTADAMEAGDDDQVFYGHVLGSRDSSAGSWCWCSTRTRWGSDPGNVCTSGCPGPGIS